MGQNEKESRDPFMSRPGCSKKTGCRAIWVEKHWYRANIMKMQRTHIFKQETILFDNNLSLCVSRLN
jgi:hypothetical protein